MCWNWGGDFGNLSPVATNKDRNPAWVKKLTGWPAWPCPSFVFDDRHSTFTFKWWWSAPAGRSWTHGSVEQIVLLPVATTSEVTPNTHKTPTFSIVTKLVYPFEMEPLPLSHPVSCVWVYVCMCVWVWVWVWVWVRERIHIHIDTFIHIYTYTYICIYMYIYIYIYIYIYVSYMNESCLASEWVVAECSRWFMSQVWMSHVSHVNESCLTYECVMTDRCRFLFATSQVWMRHASLMSHISIGHGTELQAHVTWIIYMWHDPFIFLSMCVWLAEFMALRRKYIWLLWADIWLFCANVSRVVQIFQSAIHLQKSIVFSHSPTHALSHSIATARWQVGRRSLSLWEGSTKRQNLAVKWICVTRIWIICTRWSKNGIHKFTP